ncbi:MULTISPECIES: carbohydrate deacetylase [unclassified Kaistella]|uniref:carbohydrate deacetylase n=1 Tax=unclassified Kaistella TaxID=2762626 RepID=UPI00273511F9|nr:MULTISPECIES: ChbG/HpnK family deacetylase [unclassified Kaistella]MDP2454941.1 ChbG/HpnK family deacetylase [Kaistella sp. SH11-4b]MDP2456076.1 ChbG/HpnK family deacetylase [Kaistella sp. SH40-3]MDP2460611.1 ChbG/HpnK family deacetylase [Kaistella sp. SH19-2b]
MKKIILNADDLGFSLGVNEAILNANRDGYLSHASLMANTKYFDHAISEVIPNCPSLKVGVHVNLTCASPLFSQNLLSIKGELKNTFITLLFRRKTKKVLQHLEQEIELQILKIKNAGINISHIDGHEHVHIIPSINKIVRKLANKHNILRVREINENIFESYQFNGRTASFANVIKLFLLKFLSLFNENSREIGFYSMLNTCEINSTNLFAFLQKSKNYSVVEVMVHPGILSIDSAEYFESLNERFATFLKDGHRKSEYGLCFDKRFENFKNCDLI